MAEMVIPFGVQSSPGRVFADTGPRHFNCWAEPHEDAKVPAPIHAFDGFELFATLTLGGRYRGHIIVEPYAYVIAGNGLFKVDQNGSSTMIGGVPGTGFVSMDRNQAFPVQITYVAEAAAFVVENDTTTQVTDPDLLPPVSVTTVAHSSVYATANGEIVYSEVDDAANIATGSVLTAEAEPDGLVRGVEFKGDLWLFGKASTQIFKDSGEAADRFRPMAGGVLRRGCASAGTIAKVGEMIVWLGDDNHVYRATGQGYEPLSHDGVVRAVASVTDKTTITGSAFSWRGTPFYALSSDDWTWQVNLKTGKWFERKSYGITRWLAEGAFHFGNDLILGDYEDGKLYRLKDTLRSENGTKNVMLLRSGIVNVFPKLLVIDRLCVDLETGVGLNSTDPHTSDPQIGLRVSYDGGATWSNQRYQPIGGVGQRRTTVTWESLGEAPRGGMVFELEMSSPVVRTFLGAKAYGEAAEAA